MAFVVRFSGARDQVYLLRLCVCVCVCVHVCMYVCMYVCIIWPWPRRAPARAAGCSQPLEPVTRDSNSQKPATQDISCINLLHRGLFRI